MPSFQPKKYQQSSLESIAAYFRECQAMGNADYAFQEVTKALWERKSDFTPLKGFPDEMPYFCLRVPTGGGKTYLAAKSVAMVNNLLLHTEHSVILWLVPSKAIRKRGAGRIKITPVDVDLGEEIDFKSIPKETRKKLKWNKAKKVLTINAPLSNAETEEVKAVAIMEQTQEVIAQAGEASRTQAVEIFHTPSEKGATFMVPELEVIIDGELRLFDEAEALDYPWELPLFQARPTEEQLQQLNLGAVVAEGGLIDVDEEAGKVTTRFVKDLKRDLGLAYRPEHWNEAKLAAWFCRQLHDRSIAHASKRAFVSHWLSDLLQKDGVDLARVNRQKFFLRSLIEMQVNHLRKEAIRVACQSFLFGDGKEERVRVGSEYSFEFHPDAYAPDRDDDGGYGDYDFQKHYYPRMGDFDSAEEYSCATWLDRQGGIEFWVRNLVRKNGASFFLQNATKRFYPDFVCKLKDGRILVVEYKGADRWVSATNDRNLGELWAELSDGKCLFVMVKDKNWAPIDDLIHS